MASFTGRLIFSSLAIFVASSWALPAAEAQSRLEHVVTAPTAIWDVANGQVLLLDEPDFLNYYLRVYDRTTKTSETVFSFYDRWGYGIPLNARLGPTGRVILSYGYGLAFNTVEVYGNGAREYAHGWVDFAPKIQTSGDYAAYIPYARVFITRRFSTGTVATHQISDDYFTYVPRLEVAPNGDIAYEVCTYTSCVDPTSWWYRAETNQALLVHPGRVGLTTDGVNAVYTVNGEIRRYTSSGPEILAASGARGSAVAGGWIAVLWRDGDGVDHLSVRSPDGVTTPITDTATAAVLEGLNASGEVMFRSGGVRYFASPTRAPLDVGSTAGSIRVDGTEWFTLIDKSLYRIDTSDRARMLNPSLSKTIDVPSVTFTWRGTAGATQYWMDVGTTPGAFDLHSGGAGLETSCTLARVPLTGSPLYVRLWTLVDAEWRYEDSVYQTIDGRALLLGPADGSTLRSGIVPFDWTAGVGGEVYWLDVGSAPGGADLYSKGQGLARTALVAGLPTDGRTVYARVWTLQPGAWVFHDRTYVMIDSHGGATLTSPVQRHLTGGRAVFRWAPVPTATAYWLDVGTTAGGSDLYPDIPVSASMVGATVTGLPDDGRPIYARLWSLVGGAWALIDYEFTTGHDAHAAVLRTPVAGETLTDDAIAFTWSAGTAATLYWLDVGTSPGGTDVYSAAQGLAQSASLRGLPSDGRLVYVRLWTLAENTWSTVDAVYQTVDADGGAVLRQPVTGTTLAHPYTWLSWTRGGSAGERPCSYWLDVGTSPFVWDVRSGSVTGTSARVHLPLNGYQLHVRLWSLFCATAPRWVARDYRLTEVDDQHLSVLTAPPAGETLRSAPVTIEWSSPATALETWLDIGRAPGGADVYSAALGAERALTLHGLPLDGAPLYVRLWTLVTDDASPTGRRWTFADYVYPTATPVP